MKRSITTSSVAAVAVILSFLMPQTVAWGGKASPACIYSQIAATSSGRSLCIRAGSFNRDICNALESFSIASRLPPDFFARLIWRESRFRAEAMSPKGAKGIAQFMPGTATLRGLADSLDLLQALRASSQYLDELRNHFGNLGLAAAAYNAGEQRVATYMLSGNLPAETRNYVFGITGHTVDEWKNTSTDLVLPPLDERRTFMDACEALADTRRLVEPADQSEGLWAPWGAQLAAAQNSAIARALFARAAAKLPSPLSGEAPLIIRKRDRDFGFRPRYSARLGRTERAEAEKACATVRRAGLPCLVFKNF